VLIAKGHAYEAQTQDGGEVLFDVSSMPDYGKLSGRKLEEQQAGARVAVEAHKKNPGDFVLWKLSSAEEPGWPSPWGRGRPGWHIECSVMSKAALGEVFDIHGGGLDLIFPHHENEIAQSRCAHGTKVMANYWMHNGFLQVEGQKMSKSLGNFTTIADVLKDWPGEVARFSMLKTHYRQPIDWTRDSLEESENTLLAWSESVEGVEPSVPDAQFLDAMMDDLNTHAAFARLYHLNSKGDLASFKASTALFGFKLDHVLNENKLTGTVRQVVLEKISARLEARKAKDWKKSDEIRDELLAMGIQIMDKKDPATGEMKTEWEVKR
jgi:cysteinyl-tRNA synthetase